MGHLACVELALVVIVLSNKQHMSSQSCCTLVWYDRGPHLDQYVDTFFLFFGNVLHVAIAKVS